MSIFSRISNLFRKKQNIPVNIQASEGDRNVQDPLQTPVTTTTRTIRKNNFTTYDDIVSEIKRKYRCFADYGVSLLGAVIDMRAAFIGGEGISIVAEKKDTQAFIDNLMEWNAIKDGAFIEWVGEGEKEGKDLIILKSVDDYDGVKKILYKHIPYVDTHYKVKPDDFNRPVKAAWQPDDSNPIVYQKEDFVYIWFGGNSGDINDSPPRTGRVLTQIENYERALYDLRENNHLFGFSTPVFETQDNQTAQWIIKKINEIAWKIGKAAAFPGKAKYLEPGGGALATLKGEMELNLKLISGNTGVPVHWLAWTDLMSNRATAETLSELLEVATKKERLKWIRGIKDLIRKSMIKGVDTGVEGAVNDPDGFEVELPQLTAEKLKEIIDVWLVLNQAGKISDNTLLNKTPGVDMAEEKKFLEKERKEEEERKPPELKRFENQLNKMNEEEDEATNVPQG
jgi:hypothetical protein